MAPYELLLKNGTLIDPARNMHARTDIAFNAGKVVQAAPDLATEKAHRCIDCTGAYVAPGMVDLHVHTYWGVSHYGLDRADAYCAARGATTILDPGSAGADTFDGFKRYVIDRLDTRVYALINVSCLGMISFDFGETILDESLNVAKALNIIDAHRDVIAGVKVRLGEESQGSDRTRGLKPLEIAREIADHCNLLLMVHPLDAYCESIDDILVHLKAGDVLTHTFHRYHCGILDDSRRLRDAVLEARGRGVLFDVGHGMASFCWDVAEAAVSKGFWPDTISSDLHTYNFKGPVFDLATTADKFLHLGMPLDNVIKAVTATPARTIGKQDMLGNLQPGAIGDAVVFAVDEGRFDLFDGTGEMVDGKWRFYNGTGKKRAARQKIRILNVIKDGRLY